MDAYVYLVIALVFGVGLCIGFVLGRVSSPGRAFEEPYPVVKTPAQPEGSVRYFGNRPMPQAPLGPDFETDPFFAHDGEDEHGVERRVAKPFAHV